MDEFKIRPGDNQETFDLTEDIYFEKTNRQAPYKNRSLSDGKKTMYFATCPECENPIEIRNLVKDGSISDSYPEKIFGQHYLHFHPGVLSLARNGRIDRDAYEDCSYAGDRTLRKNGPVRANNKVNDQILQSLAVHACRIKRLINLCLGVNVTNKLFLEIIDEFVGGEGYRHRAVTIRNLPYAVAFMSERQTLAGYVRDDATDLRDAIVKSDWFDIESGLIIKKKKQGIPENANIGFFFSRFRVADYGTGEPNRMRLNVKIFRGREEVGVIYRSDREFYNNDFKDSVKNNQPWVSTEQIQDMSDMVKLIILKHRPGFNFDQPISF